jgi:hypothetical protein
VKTRLNNTRQRRVTVAGIFLAAIALVVAPALASRGSHSSKATARPGVRGALPSAVLTARDAAGHSVTLWSRPSANGGECRSIEFGSTAIESYTNPTLGCEDSPQTIPLSLAIQWIRNNDGTYSVAFQGAQSAGTGIQSISLESSDPGTSFATKSGRFLGQLAATSASGTLPSGSFAVVGRDAAGNIVSRLDFAAVVAKSRPPATN